MTVNVAILGFAHGHVGAYCDQWRKHPELGVNVVAGWDHDPTRASSSREKFAIEVFDTPEALLVRDDIQAVVIGAETSLHADLVEKAAAAGKAIVLQKPMALTLQEADRIVAAVNRHHVPFTLAWQMRIDPQNIEMKRLIQSGEIGRVYMLRRRHGLSTHVWPGFENTWHVKPELNRGMFADDASHAIDWLLWTLGKPQSVTAQIATLRSDKVPDDHGIAIFRYPDGTFAEIVCSFVCLAGENTTEIIAEDAVVIQNYGDAPSCQVPRPEGAAGLKWFTKGAKDWTISPIASPRNHGERIAALAPEIAKFLQGQRPPIATAEDGRTSLAMTLACYKSSELGRAVTMEETNLQ
jgi:predicted dehydrogenase